ncbi:MAG: hypothetical protein HY074_11250 [Deltaproteobacteria bacterium]|nr:hypothetical protein [Deltaproteobacteria bacterium]
MNIATDHVFPNTAVTQGTPLTLWFQNTAVGVDPSPVTYTCSFDQIPDGAMVNASDCSQLPGTVSFSSSVGILTWTPNQFAIGAYEILATAVNGNSSAAQIVTVDVRQPYAQTNLLADLDANFGNIRGVAFNPQAKWRDLTNNGFDGVLTGMLATLTSGFSGAPYSIAYDGALGRVDFGATLIPPARTTMAFSTWIAPKSATTGSTVILGNGGENGNGFALTQSALAPGSVELRVGSKSYSALVVGDAPTAYWRLGESSTASPAVDATGNGHTGTYNGAVTLGVAGMGADPGQTAATITSNATNMSFTRIPLAAGLTLEAWINTTDSSAGVAFAGNAKNSIFGDTNAAVHLGFGIESGLVTYRHFDGALWQVVQSGHTVDDGNWHHVAVEHNSATGLANIFVDGVLDGALVITYSVASAAVSVVGGGNGGTDFFNGSIEEVAVFPTPLSAAKILTHFQAGRPMYKDRILADQPVAYWRLGESGSGMPAADVSGQSNNGVYTGTGMTMSNLGAVTGTNTNSDDGNTAVGFDGTGNGWVNINSSASLKPAATVSVEAWVYFTGAAFAAENPIMAKYPGATGYLLDLVNGTPQFFVKGTTSPTVISTAGLLPKNVWVHMAGTYDGTTIRYYQNGVLSGSQASTGAITQDNTAATIGAYLNGLHPFQGYISEVAVYNYMLTLDQIQARVNAKAGVVCRSRTTFANGVRNFVSGLWDGTTLTMFVNGRSECSISGVGTFTTPATNLVAGAAAAPSKEWAGSMGDLRIYSSGATTDPLTNFVATAPRFQGTSTGNIVTNGLVFNVDAANARGGTLPYANGCATNAGTWPDLASHAIDGALMNFVSTDCSGGAADGWQGSGSSTNPYRLVFDGVDDHVLFRVLAFLPQAAGTRTLEAWIKPANAAAAGGTIMCLGDGGAVNQQFCLEYARTGGADPIFSDAINAGNGISVTDAKVGALNAWSHVAFTTDALKNWVYYLNGAAQASGTFPTAINTSLGQLKIGNRTDAVNLPFAGSVAKAAIYNRVLTPAEISQNCSALVSRFSGAVCN